MRKHRIQLLRSLFTCAGLLALGAGTAFADPTPKPGTGDPNQPNAIFQEEAKKDGTGMPTTMKIGGTTWTLYGFVEAGGAWNDSRMNSLQLPVVAAAESPLGGAVGHNKGRFGMWARHSRFGISMKSEPIEVLWDATPSAVLEVDFLGGGGGVAAGGGFVLFNEAISPMRIRKAFLRLEMPLGDGDDEDSWFALQVGQDWEIISPLRPGVNEETYMWGSGNTGGFRPHIRAEMNYALADNMSFLGQIALGVTSAQDLKDADANGAFDGEVSEVPNFQLRAAMKMGVLDANNPVTVGLWIHKHWEATDLPIGGVRTRFHGWGWGLDFQVSLMKDENDDTKDKVYIRGEFYSGANLADIRGGTAGGIFPGRAFPGGGSGKNVSETGGWLEGGYALNESLTVIAGWGLVDPENKGLRTTPPFAIPVASNSAVYGGLVYDVAPIKIGVELIYWRTVYLLSGLAHSDGNAMRYRFFLRYSF